MTFPKHALSRRQLLKAGAATTAVMATTSVFSPLLAAADDDEGGRPKPVPANADFFGLRAYFPQPDMEPSTITDFRGVVGVSGTIGTGVHRTKGGASKTMVFENDVRFMQGVFRSTDGRTRRGTFAAIGLLVYAGTPDFLDPNTSQIYHGCPGIGRDGLFWTMRVPDDAVDVNFAKGVARFRMNHVRMRDYHTVANAIGFPDHIGTPGPSVPSTVSMDLKFFGPTSGGRTVDPKVGFVLDFKPVSAHLDWSMTTPEASYHSNPDGQSSPAPFTFLGRERNGVFFSPERDDGPD